MGSWKTCGRLAPHKVWRQTIANISALAKGLALTPTCPHLAASGPQELQCAVREGYFCYNGTVMLDSLPLSTYGIARDSNIDCRQRMAGGMPGDAAGAGRLGL